MKDLFSEYFRKIDFISEEFNFEYKNSKIYKTYQGAVFSLITILTAGVIAITFGREVYLRRNPNVNSSDEVVADSTIHLNNYPLVFGLVNNNALPINNIFDYFDISVNRLGLDKTGTYFKDTNLTFHECSIDQFTITDSYKQLFNDSFSNQPSLTNYCINATEATVMKNELGRLDSSSIRIIMAFCNPNEVGRNCKSNQAFLAKLPAIMLKYISYNIDSLNYDNPVNSYVKTEYFSLTQGIQKINYLYFVNNIYKSDDGWLLEDYREIVYPNLQSTVRDVNLVSGDLGIDYCISFHFRSNQIRNRIQRNYMKVQELLAKVGGISNAALILTKLISYHYLRYLYLAFIREHSFVYLKNELKKGYDRFYYINANQGRAQSLMKYNENSSNNLDIKNKNTNLNLNHNNSVNVIKDGYLNDPGQNQSINSINKNNNNSNNNIISGGKEIFINNVNSINYFKDNSKLCLNNVEDNNNISKSKDLSAFSNINKNDSNVNILLSSNINSINIINKPNNDVKNKNDRNDVSNDKDKILSNINHNANPDIVKVNFDEYKKNSQSKERINNFNNNNNNKNKDAIDVNMFNEIKYFNEHSNNSKIRRINNLSVNEFSEATNDETVIKKEINYFDYLVSQIFCCAYYKSIEKKYSFEFNRVKDILDIRLFKHYLIKSYYDRYFDNK